MGKTRQLPYYAETLTRLLAERDWTPYRLAIESGVTRQTVHNLLDGSTGPSYAVLLSLSRALSVSPRVFFTDEVPS